MKTILPTNSSERPLPAVHGALLELHLLAIRLLPKSGVRQSERAQVRRSTVRATLAVGMAAAGHRRRQHLRRAHEIMTSCLDLFSIFHLENSIDAAVYAEFHRRINQILSALDHLSAANETEWLASALPPAEPVDEEKRPNPTVNVFEDLLARIDAVAQLLVPHPPAAEPPHGGKRVEGENASLAT